MILRDVIDHVWQSSLFAGLAWVMTLTLLRKNRPQARYAVWFAASIKFLIPFAVLVDLGSRLQWIHRATAVAQAQWRLVVDQTARFATPHFVPTPPAAIPASSSSLSFSSFLAVLWVVGVVVAILNWAVRWWRIRAVVRAASHLRIVEGVPVLTSPALRQRGLEPGVFGFFRPVILLPDGITDRLSAQQFEAVLIHECCHARRRDNLAAAIHMTVEALFWFHPLVWWVGQRLMQERERACDEEVLRRAHDPAVYAEGILNVCKFYVGSPLPCVAGVSGSNLKGRIEEIMTYRNPLRLSWIKRSLLAAAGVAAVLVPVAVGLLNAQATNSFLGLATTASKKFEVATIKQHTDEDQGSRLGPPGRGSISIVNLRLRQIIIQSFRTQRTLVFGGSDWIDTERYDIVGKGPDPTVANPEVWEMMRSLLLDRFHLKYHLEDREVAVYALTVAKGGLKLKAGEDGRCAKEIKAGQPCGDIIVPPFGAAMYNMPIGALITSLAGKLGRPLIDKTGLTGKYDANVTWLPDGAKLADLADILPNIPEEYRPQDMSVFEALEKQAGLKLESTKAPMKSLIIDSVDRPSEN